MAKAFSANEWTRINDFLEARLQPPPGPAQKIEPFGLPAQRADSVLIGTFNIRKLGQVGRRSDGAWDFLARICRRFDLLAIQEIQDNLSGIRKLKRMLGEPFGMALSDTTGKTPGSSFGMPERLAFLFQWARISRTELASDISYDRTAVVQTLFDHRDGFTQTLLEYAARLKAWEHQKEINETLGKKSPRRPTIALPTFLTFIRQPHCASFQVKAAEGSGADPYEFLAVNAHLLYGGNKTERRLEFYALIEWLAMRAKYKKNTYYDNLLLLGDCNLEFDEVDVERSEMDAWLKALNRTKLKSKRAAKANFPLLYPHPDAARNPLRTNARQDQTYDQIALFMHDKRLPEVEANQRAGTEPDGFDYGVFKFTDLFAEALYGRPFAALNAAERDHIVDRTADDVSDHMPAWIRLPVPGT